MFQITPIEFASPEYDLAVRLRYDVLRRPLGLDFTPEQLAAEWPDVHLACFDRRETLVGCLILTKNEVEKTVKMRQVAVREDLQKQGIGQQLVAYSEVWARRNGFQKMTLHARDTAIPFYEKLGYTTIGERFVEVGISHFKMEKSL